MTGKKLSQKFFFGFVMVLCVLWLYGNALSEPQRVLSSSELKQKDNSTQQLWSLVTSLQQLRSDYYEKQSQHTDRIQQLHDTSKKLQAEVEELRRRENQINESLAKINSDIENLHTECEKDKVMKLAVAKKLDDFVAEHAKRIEKGIPYRQDDRLMRLKGDALAEQSVANVFGGIWNFSQEEMRIARSGETFTDMVSLSDERFQHARLFRIGHKILGYLTEQDDQAGIWVDGVGWEKVQNSEAEAVKAVVRILDRRRIPGYIQLPVKIELVDIKTKGSKD